MRELSDPILKNIIARCRSQLVQEENEFRAKQSADSDWMKVRQVSSYLALRELPPLTSFVITECSDADLSNPIAAWKLTKAETRPIDVSEVPQMSGAEDGCCGFVSFFVCSPDKNVHEKLYEQQIIGPRCGSRYAFRIVQTSDGIELSDKEILRIY